MALIAAVQPGSTSTPLSEEHLDRIMKHIKEIEDRLEERIPDDISDLFPNISSGRELKELMRKLEEAERKRLGWRCEKVTVTSKDVPALGKHTVTADFWFRDMTVWLKDLLDDPDLQPSFAYCFKEKRNAKGQR